MAIQEMKERLELKTNKINQTLTKKAYLEVSREA